MSTYKKLWMRAALSTGVLSLVFIASGFGVDSLAQNASWSRGIQKLSISHDECKDRARRALEAEGYKVENQGGDLAGDYFYAGSKSNHSAVVACNSSQDGKTWANVFVASSVSYPDGNVPGAERVRLQQRMDQAVARGCGLGTRWTILSDSGWSGAWTRRGNSNVFDGSWQKGSERFTAMLTITMTGNRVVVQRRNATTGGDCEFNGTVADDGVTVSGTNVCTHGQGQASLKIECQ